MIRQTKVGTAAVALICLGLSLVAIDSLSTVKHLSRRSSWKRPTGSRQCPSSRASAFRLFSASDFSSHPYSVYYGTSGSTAQQNFGQNDDINDVYGYGPDFVPPPEEPFDNNRQLKSMQDVPLVDGRRGATVFSRKFDDERPQFYEDPRVVEERERMFHEDRYIEDGHRIDQVDSLMHERDDLRRELDAVVTENMHLHSQQNMNGARQVVPPQGQNQYSSGTNSIYQGAPQAPSPLSMGHDQSTRSVVDSVMDELKNMQRTVQAVEAGQHRRNIQERENSEAATSVANIKSELKNMEQVLKNLEQERPPSSAFAANINGYNAETGESSHPEYTNLNGSAPSVFEQQPNPDNINSEGSRAEHISNVNGSIQSDHASKLFDGQYEVVIKAELKKKNGFEGTHHPVEKQIDVNNTRESPTVCGGSFGSKYI